MNLRLRLADWRPGHLLLAWCAYWVALVLIAVAPALPTLWRLRQNDTGGTASISFGDKGLELLVSQGGNEWTRVIGVGVIAASVAIPPLLLWALWLRAQKRRPEIERVSS